MEENFKDIPIQIVIIKENGDFELTVEGIAFLSSLKNKKVSILAITGPYRSGKSFLANLIMNRMSGFKTGSTTNTCTRGIWSWGRPQKISDDNYLIIMDSEGLGSVERDRELNVDLKIFTLTVLISTMVIYNTKNHITEDKIEELSTVANLSKRINILKKNNDNSNLIENDFSNFFPKLIWILRDFTLDVGSLTPKEYLEKSLEKSNSEGAEAKNLNREIIKSNFKSRDCITMVKPTTDEQKLRNLENESKSVLRSEFLKQIENIISYVKENITPKKIGNIFLDGEALFGLIINFIESINNDENPVIMSALENVLLSKATNASEKIMHEFRKTFFEKNINSLPLDNNSIINEFFKSQSLLIPKYCELVHDTLSTKQLGEYIIKLNSRMKDELENLIESNNVVQDELYQEAYDELAKGLQKTEINKIDEANNIVFTLTQEWYNEVSKFFENVKLDNKIDNFILKILSEQIFQGFRNMCGQISDLFQQFKKDMNHKIEINRTTVKKYEDLLAQERKINEERQKEKSELFASKIELESKNERLTREINSKRKEFEEMLKTENQKLLNLKNYYENILNDKDEIITKQEKKIDSLTKQLNILNRDMNNKTIEFNKEINNKFVEIQTLKGKEKSSNFDTNDFKLNTLKAVVGTFQNIYTDFKENVEKLDRDKENMFKKQFLELSTREVDSRSKNWLEELKKFQSAHVKSITEEYERTISKLKEELEETQLSLSRKEYEMKEETHMKETYKIKYEETKKQYLERESMSDSKDSIIQKHVDNNFVSEKKIDALNNSIENLLIRLNNNIIESKMKGEELETVLVVLEGIMSKKKDKYEHNISRLPNETKSLIDKLVKEYKFNFK